jgi:hypothetical protein
VGGVAEGLQKALLSSQKMLSLALWEATYVGDIAGGVAEHAKDIKRRIAHRDSSIVYILDTSTTELEMIDSVQIEAQPRRLLGVSD